MQPTWLETFHEQTNLNQYPITLRTRGGIGYKMPSGETVSNFVGHPVHYFENGLWKPITLKPHANGDFEGSDFSWRGKQVFYKGKTLFEPRAVIFNGVEHKLFLRQDGNRIVADLTIGGSAAQYEIQFRESGVRELLTIFEPVEGLLEFDIPHANKPEGLFKKDRHIIGGITAESFQLTAEMTYPLVIDPDYAADSEDGYIYGQNATYSTARSTATFYGTYYYEIQNSFSGGSYHVYRGLAKFNTAGIPDSDFVSQVVLSAKLYSKSTTPDWDILISKHDWSGQDPVSGGNMETVFDAALAASLDDNIWQNTSAISAGSRYDSGNLSTSWINKTGFTYYALLNKNDRDNSTPVNEQRVQIHTYDSGASGDRPYLTVTHAAASGRANRMTLLGVG